MAGLIGASNSPISGVGVIIMDEVLSRIIVKRPGHLGLPPLAVGMGMYLPVSLTLGIPFGALLGWLYNRWADGAAAKGKVRDRATAKRIGVLAATGLIVGESLFGVVNAGIVAATGEPEALGIMPAGWASASEWAGALVFLAIIGLVYRWSRRRVTTEA